MRSPATTTNDVMADDFSQGMQIGANLWDRAQTQRRMVDQLNMQVADQVMRQKTADIQNQMQQFNLRDALEEKTNQEADLPVFYDYQKQVSEFLNNPSAEAPMPALPQFKSRTYRMEAEKAAGDLRDVSVRKAAMQNQQQTRQLLAQHNNALHSQYTRELDDALATGDPAILELVNGQSEKIYTPTGAFNPQVLTELRTAMLPFKKKQADIKAATAERLANPTTMSERIFGKQLQNLVDMGLLDKNDPVKVSEAENYLTSRTKITTDDVKAINASDSAIKGLKSAESLATKLEAKYGPQALREVVGPFDGPVSTLKAKLYDVTPQDLADAKQVKREIANVVNQYRKGIFGATLPPQEIAEMEKVVPSDKSNDYFVAAKGFRDILERGVGVTISRNKYSPLIDLGLKKSYAPDIFMQESTTVTPAVAPSKTTSGKTFLIEQIP